MDHSWASAGYLKIAPGDIENDRGIGVRSRLRQDRCYPTITEENGRRSLFVLVLAIFAFLSKYMVTQWS